MGAQSNQRRPEAGDLAELFELISEGKSLRAACRDLGLHAPSTHTMIDRDDDHREHYARAREMRAEVLAEQALTIGLAAALKKKVDNSQVDPAGARVALDAIKWATARMAPKTAPVERYHLTFGAMTDEELDGRIAALSGHPAIDEG